MGRFSPKFGVQCQLWIVHSPEERDTFFTTEHALLQLNVGFLKREALILKFTRSVKFFFSVLSMSTLKKTA